MNTIVDNTLIPALEATPAIKTWQLNVTSTHSLKSGFINDKFGGIYRPVVNSLVEKLDFRVLLNDGRSSIGSAPVMISPQQLIAQIMASAHKATQPLVFATKQENFEMVPLVDARLQKIIQNEPEKISELTRELQKQQLDYGHKLTKGGVQLISSERRLVSSSGIDMIDPSTRQTMSASYEGRMGFGVADRSFFGVDRMSEQSSSISHYTKQLATKPATLANGSYPILLDADTGWELLDTFVLNNAKGQSVEAGQSRFKPKDFQAGRMIAHPGFSLHYNQRKPMGVESFNFSSQGTISQEFDLVKNGALTQPICEPKTAKSLGYNARALSTTLTTDVSTDRYQDFVHKNPTFLLIFGLLGIHTTKAILGTYSLPAPDALLIQDGQVVGPVNVVLSGNFFDVLMQPSTRFVDAPHLFDSPALTFETQVTVK